MLIQKDNFLVSVTDTVERPMLYGENGIPLIIDTDYHPKEHRKQTGRICGLPIKVTSQYIYDNPLEIGDAVLFNHLAMEDLQKFKEKIYRVEYYFIFAKINNGVLEPLEDFIMCDPMNIENNTVIKQIDKRSTQFVKAVAVSNKAKEFGVQVGDIIFITKNADYSFKVGEKEFTRIRIRNVIAIERNGELLPMKDKVMVEQINETQYVMGIPVLKKPSNQKKGVVVKKPVGMTDIAVGETIAYYLGTASGLEWKGGEYAFVKENNIKFIYQ